MHVVSASRRTDIPAFHARWFMNRVRAGYARVVSPFGGGRFEVSLLAEDVAAIVFWTKNAGPLLPHLDELNDRGYCFTFLYSINNYPSRLEPGVPDRGHTMKVVEALAKKFAPSILRWRYDTIVLTETLDRQWHMANFRSLCRSLSDFTSSCIFSFCDYYRKTIRNMARLVPDHYRPDEVQCREMVEEMADIAAGRGISLSACAHDFLVSDKVGKARCIDPEFLKRVVDSDERRKAVNELKAAPTRKECGCVASRDIGAYDTCAHGCVYCYANSDPARARDNVSRISPQSDCLAPAQVQGAG